MKQKKPSSRLLSSAAEDLHNATDPHGSEQSRSAAYRLAYDDLDFVLRDELRPVRLLLELSKTELGLEDHGIDHTVVVFGSARTLSPDQANKLCEQAELEAAKSPTNELLKTVLKRAKTQMRYAGYYQQAQKLGELIGQQSGHNNVLPVHVMTGGGPGIMEAANRGASAAGADTIGLNIVLPKEQKPNPYITPDLCFRFHYFAMRKMHFLLRAKALVVFPGGYGTLDELLDTLTLMQTEKIKPMPILLFGRNYWQRLIDFDFLLEEGMIAEKDLQYFQYVDEAEEAWDIIKESLSGITDHSASP
ncbi:MAG: TIGR00730 family Rossman fold protein [Halioglobus sp.]